MSYQDFQRQYPNAVILIGETSSINVKFYNAYEKSAEVLHDLTGYQLITTSNGTLKCGGPKLSIIEDKLKFANQSYKLISWTQILESWDAEPENSAINICVKAHSYKIEQLYDYLDTNGYQYSVNNNDKPTDNVKAEPKTVAKFPEKTTVAVKPKNSAKPNTKVRIKNGDKIILADCETGETTDFLLCATEIEYKYTGAGGSYYGAKVEQVHHSDAGEVLDDGTIVISSESLLGSKLIGKSIDDVVSFIAITGKKISYKVIDITQPE